MKPFLVLVVLAGPCLSCSSSKPTVTHPPKVATPAAPAAPVVQVPPPESAKAPDKPPQGSLRQLFPHVRADLQARLVEFDGTVPIDCHDPQTPVVYLEVTVCTPDTKEHESLVVTPAKPSHVHAALLAAGYQPGKPGSWTWDGQMLSSVPPSGDSLAVSIAYRDAAGGAGGGRDVEVPATSWIRNAAASGQKFGASPGSRFVFAGSAMVTRQGREVYNSNGSGLLIGLTTFGSETIAWSEVISHEADIMAPEWIADASVVPRFGTPVVVRIRPGPAISGPAR
jgi:hypothetical protein